MELQFLPMTQVETLTFPTLYIPIVPIVPIFIIISGMWWGSKNNKIGKIARAAKKEFGKKIELLEPRGPQSHVTLAARGTIYENLS